ncbi:TetR/AcrR family transcriptional regulator [Limobrevibacterium gyesilva]|uniref:TetR/AcrR family transcriptional regulator n=1 Tax=Limobrevibacterium gyesilva TaxID=2991712 RepID=A0AA41YPA1_9PROT|nr:TetR/AcrR family transcriptional regulator [Limobrevibacterium gyesilva]MCW3473037.1 TetR/AcrR family transcriptional regulator [Limobrevibacterium gyesilva]
MDKATRTRPTGAARSPAKAPGRPRSDATRQSVLRAAFELLTEGGLARFTIEGVAARSGVARTTIYRWWPKKGALAMEGFLEATAPEIRFPKTTSAVADMKAQLRLCAKLLRGRAGRIICGVIVEGQTDPETIAAFIEGYLQPRRREARAILQRGIDSGEMRPDLDMSALLSALYSPMHLRLLLGEPIDDAWVDSLADTVLQGCLATPTAPAQVRTAAPPRSA